MFLDIQFPQELLLHFNKTVQYLTSIGKMQNGREFRRSIMDKQLTIYSLIKSIKQSEKISLLEDFFHTVHGQRYSFKMFDATDCKMENSQCRILTPTSVQMQKSIQFQEMVTVKDITKPKEGTVQVFKDGALLVSGYTVDYQVGVIVFDEDITSSVITVSCEYFHHVRFETDSITFAMKGGGSFEVENVAMVEVLN